MREILLKPQLHKFHTFEAFAREYELNEKDLLFTTGYLYEHFIKPHVSKAQVVIQDEYGDGEPTEEMAEAVWQAADYDSYDRVIAVGGGTVMDLGKLLTVRRTGSVNQLFFKKAELIREKTLIAVPTTCGTGSEVTSTSVAIVKDEKGNTTKLGLLSEALIADTACLIPEFLAELPQRPFAESLIDALIHATEAFLSPGRATMTSDLFAKGAIELILTGMKKVQETENFDLRTQYGEELLTAACYAGIAFLQAGCGTVHGLSYPLSGAYFVTHGASNYTFFEEVLKLYDRENPEGKIRVLKETISRIFGCKEGEALQVLAQAEEKLIPPRRLKDYGVKKEDLKLFTESVFLNQKRLVDNSYVPLNKEKVLALYEAVY